MIAVEAIVSAARASGATVLEAPGATVIVLPAAAASDPDQLLPLADAAKLAATSVRVLRDAIRAGVLPAHGRQRDRAIRRRELESWIETRRAPVGQVADDQAARVERRLQAKRAES
ncbi:MAG: helix-turn-helix domain-containing protein [Myxococcales bacterium]|nr:helix-turn-helix domain-containing protein [Myxococcales bacterium]